MHFVQCHHRPLSKGKSKGLKAGKCQLEVKQKSSVIRGWSSSLRLHNSRRLYQPPFPQTPLSSNPPLPSDTPHYHIHPVHATPRTPWQYPHWHYPHVRTTPQGSGKPPREGNCTDHWLDVKCSGCGLVWWPLYGTCSGYGLVWWPLVTIVTGRGTPRSAPMWSPPQWLGHKHADSGTCVI